MGQRYGGISRLRVAAHAHFPVKAGLKSNSENMHAQSILV